MNKIDHITVQSQIGTHIVRLYESSTGKIQFTINAGVVSGLYDSQPEAIEAAFDRIIGMVGE